MNILVKSQLARIHIAKKSLRLDDDSYRSILERVTGKASSAAMTVRERNAVLDEFQRLGWKDGGGSGGAWRARSQKSYVRLMFAIAKTIGDHGYWRYPYKKALQLFVKEKTGIDNPEWLTADQAAPVIEALKQIERRVKS
ncbi:regulatory protein GemA [Labrenzia sp. R4_2]|uniref:gp16 family protein n=1 Tax=Labrenzia sp. R4_2 TaxID=2821107 RepID=UPI001ADB5F09|nr:regulatory protein GemA [Labrenzia sp. R4_2]MBO9421732.1 regulatory protein GemA [Labrenzia sp. R4_2]